MSSLNLNTKYILNMYMGTLTIVLSDEIEEKLRDTVNKLYGSSKGALSKVVEDALRNYLFSLESGQRRLFRAYRGDTLVGEAESLDELAALLKEKKVDLRGLKIVSSEKIKTTARSGYRVRT